jgi:ABC-type lipoprotein release transport system permease subunit
MRLLWKKGLYSAVVLLTLALGIAALTAVASLANEVLWRQRLSNRILGAFSLAALGIVLLGVFGVTSYMVARRSREIGIRMAMGASLEDIWKIMLTQNFVQVIIGLAFGVAGSIALTRVLQGSCSVCGPAIRSRLPPLRGHWPCGIGGFSCSGPQAARIDPVLALRTE